MKPDSQQQKNEIRNMSETAGWLVLEYRINEQLKMLRNQLENDHTCELRLIQEKIKAFKYVLRQVEEAREKKDGISI